MPSFIRPIRRLSALAAALLFSAPAALPAEEPPTRPPEWHAAVRSTNELGLRLLWDVRSGANSVLSPLALSLGLGQLYAGADGATRDEMRRALRYPTEEAELHRGFQRLRAEFDAPVPSSDRTFTQFRLHCAGGVFLQQGFEPLPEWQDLVERHYGSRPERVDFAQAPEVAAKAINAWISRQTQGRIDALVPPTGLPTTTRVAVLSALHYRAKWAEILQTRPPAPFRRADAPPVVVPMMGAKTTLPYRKFATFAALRIPFRVDFDLLIVLPDALDGLPALERELTSAVLEECQRLPEVRVDLTLPPFRLAPPTLQMQRPLLRLGLRSVFDDPVGSANLRRLAPPRLEQGGTVYLAASDIWHRAEFQIDRFGAEGSAGNVVPPGTKRGALPMPPTPTPPPPIVITVDRPFLFALCHRSSGAMLFLGRIEHLDASNAIRPAVAPPEPEPEPKDGEIRDIIMDFDAPELEADPDQPE